MWDVSRELFRAWIQPDSWTLIIAAYWALFAVIAWLETAKPAFHRPPGRDRRWPTNIGLGLINMMLLPLAPVSAVIGATWAQSGGWGLLNLLDLPWWVVVFATLVIRSLVEYAFHILMHKIPLLWRLHRVHHSDAHLDVTTAVRDHPLEIVALILTLALTSAVFGLNVWVLIAYDLTESVISLAAHANLRLPDRLDRAVRWVFITPNMHCLHHSAYQPETDSNYGQVFSVWDRLFGTYSAAPHKGYDAMQIGLEDVQDERSWDFWWQIRSPMFRSLQR